MRRDCYRNSKQKYCSGTRITDRTASDICLEKESYTVILVTIFCWKRAVRDRWAVY